MSRDAPEMAFTAASLPLHSSKKKAEEEVKTNREWERAKASGRGKEREGKGKGEKGAACRRFCFNIHILASEIIR